MKKNNKGFSYIELILVIAIAAILMGLVGLTIGLVSRTNVNKAADKLYTTLNQARATSMGRGNSTEIEIYCKDGEYYYFVGDPAKDDKDELSVSFISKPAVVSYINAGDTDATAIGEGGSLKLKYDKASGAFASSVSCEYIIISNGDKEAKIRLYHATGKCDFVY